MTDIQQSQPAVTVQGPSTVTASSDRSVLEIVRDTLICLACLCVLALTANVVLIQYRLGESLSQLNPAGEVGSVVPVVPVPTPDCPFGIDGC